MTDQRFCHSACSTKARPATTWPMTLSPSPYTISSRNENLRRMFYFRARYGCDMPELRRNDEPSPKPESNPNRLHRRQTPDLGNRYYCSAFWFGAVLVGALSLQDQPQTHTTSVAPQPTPDRTPGGSLSKHASTNREALFLNLM